MTKVVKTTLHFMDGEGRNLTDARANASAKIENVLLNYQMPRITLHDTPRGRYTCIVGHWFRWYYILIPPGASEGPYWSSVNRGEDYKEAVFAMYRHLAQYEFTFEDDGSRWIDKRDTRGLADHRSWAACHHRIRAWQSLGYNDNFAHAHMHEWPSDFETTYTEDK